MGTGIEGGQDLATGEGRDAASYGRLLAAVALISLAALALQVLQMRIFAFALWHHLAFLVISIAILGFGAAGALVASIPLLRPENIGNALGWAGLGFAATSLMGVWVLNLGPIDVFAQFDTREVARVGLYYLVFSAPYLCAGYVIALALARKASDAPRLYFVNLMGSGAGCFLIFATLTPLGAEGTLLAVAAVGAAIAPIVATRPVLRVAGAVAAVALLAAIPIGPRILPIPVAGSKFLALLDMDLHSKRIFAAWTPLSRLDVVKSPSFPNPWIFQDGDAPTSLPSASPLVPGDARALPFEFMEQPKVLIIGSGGGLDVQTAVEYGARHVTAAEINPVTVRLSSDPAFSSAAHLMRADPRVDLHNAEGRFFVRSSDTQYDLIQMTGVDTYTALASGAYVLSESYLYTMEAFHDYLDHLTEDGMIAIHRFAFPAPRETLRIMVMATQALAERGVAEPWRNVVVLRRSEHEAAPFASRTTFGTLLIKKLPFSEETLDRIRDHAARHSLILDFVPDEPGIFTPQEIRLLRRMAPRVPGLREYRVNEKGMNPFYSYREAMREGTVEKFLAAYPYDVRPVSDDSPYFFNQHRISSVWDWLLERGAATPKTTDVPWVAMTELFQMRPLGLMLLVLALVQLAVLASLCIFLPLLAFRRKGIQGRGVPAVLGYFVCLGLAYILLQITSMQRFGLILGHPTYSVSIAMAGFLLSSGLGSIVSGRVPRARASQLLVTVAITLLVSAGLYHAFLSDITRWALPLAFPFRVLLTLGLIAPMGFVMGMCFPTGVRLLAERNEGLVAWAYGVNGAATVLGSVIAVWLAIGVGFVATQWLASSLYVVAALLMAAMVRASATASRETSSISSPER